MIANAYVPIVGIRSQVAYPNEVRANTCLDPSRSKALQSNLNRAVLGLACRMGLADQDLLEQAQRFVRGGRKERKPEVRWGLCFFWRPGRLAGCFFHRFPGLIFLKYPKGATLVYAKKTIL